MGSSSRVPALRHGLALLRAIAEHAGPVSAATLAREVHLPRSTTYHLLSELADAGFVTHLPDQRRYGLGIAAFEIGSAYLRHEPLERLAWPILRGLVDEVGQIAHLGVLHGAESLYLLKERPPWPATTVTDVGVRLPAQLTASGRAILAYLPKPQVRALFPAQRDFVSRTTRGPRQLAQLRRILAAEQRTGWAVEDGFVTADFASVAHAVFDHSGHPIAALSVTFRHHCPGTQPCGRTWPDLAARVRRAAHALTDRVGGAAPAS